ncbi:cation:proton antiporter [Halalkalicoccus subterraneus]|uniref:cation:proton antiporter n=1 Tax=Halalkalicoccus subterraneus TaxID=2675002 RepID=UPI000EFD8F6A|nr:cation:proton antiporter [Halalkalicoccus subterraneus]
MAIELYHVALVVIGLALLGVTVLQLVASERPVSLPIFFVAFGAAAFSVPGIPAPDPLEQGLLAEHLAELGVIIALMSLGLKIDRPASLRGWSSTWRLLAITMPLSIAGAALIGWWLVGFLLPTAVLLGAVIAPTDPVLAGEVQVAEPGEGGVNEEDSEPRFALSSEAGLNDGLAFPFTNLAIAIALVGLAPGNWLGEWLLVSVVYRIVVGTFVGVVLGAILARLVFATAPETRIARSVEGLEAIAGTLLVYGLTEIVGGYGFIAVFVAALMIRRYEHDHEYNDSLHQISELAEQVLMALIMVFFGGAIAGGLLGPLTTEGILAALAIVFLVRPIAGMVGLAGFDLPWSDRGAIAFFGIRGIGSFYYLAHGLNEAAFADADLLWAVVGTVVLVSVVLHGVTASPVMNRLH